MVKFESKVLKGFKNCGVDLTSNKNASIGVAVSGGADSISLLVSLANLYTATNPVYVISVNHNIRSAEESGGDAAYVEQVCKNLVSAGKKVYCKIVELKPGLVKETAEFRGKGIEDAARFLRYEAFDSFIAEYSLDYLCLAHNKNDQLETLLMRFFQGAGTDSSAGIAQVRGKYIRPLLEIERFEIENYLNENNIIWRTDSTNFDTDYLRNKIRHEMIPFLNQKFCGWQKAVINGGKKAEEENNLIQQELDKISIEMKGSVPVIDKDVFFNSPDVIKKRLIIKGMNLAGETERIPYGFLQDVIQSVKSNPSSSFDKRFASVIISYKKEGLFIKKAEKSHTDLVFFDIIEENGKFLFPFGEMEVFHIEGRQSCEIYINDKLVVNNIDLPFIVRNMQLDDEVVCSDGSMKKLADVMSDWHVSQEYRYVLPVFQAIGEKNQPIKAVIGSVLGYKDWIIK